jgi:hypothetical protein
MTFQHVLKSFDPISLEELNAKAEMLARLDNKYIMDLDRLAIAMASLKDSFDVLQIGTERSFGYSTRYYDDAERRAYYDHHQRRRKRCKVRVRTYVEAKLEYLEVKLIEPRATTSKHRIKLTYGQRELDQACYDFIDACHRATYETPFSKKIAPVLTTEYDRITLVARDGGERLTIDTNLRISGSGRHRRVDPDICIIETKSARGNGVADKIFRALHAQPTKRVSKFCIGMVATGQVHVRNGFLPALRKLGLADLVFPMPAPPLDQEQVVALKPNWAREIYQPATPVVNAPPAIAQAFEPEPAVRSVV